MTIKTFRTWYNIMDINCITMNNIDSYKYIVALHRGLKSFDPVLVNNSDTEQFVATIITCNEELRIAISIIVTSHNKLPHVYIYKVTKENNIEYKIMEICGEVVKAKNIINKFGEFISNGFIRAANIVRKHIDTALIFDGREDDNECRYCLVNDKGKRMITINKIIFTQQHVKFYTIFSPDPMVSTKDNIDEFLQDAANDSDSWLIACVVKQLSTIIGIEQIIKIRRNLYEIRFNNFHRFYFVFYFKGCRIHLNRAGVGYETSCVEIKYADFTNGVKKLMFDLDQLSSLNIECRSKCNTCQVCYVIKKNNIVLRQQVSLLMVELREYHADKSKVNYLYAENYFFEHFTKFTTAFMFQLLADDGNDKGGEGNEYELKLLNLMSKLSDVDKRKLVSTVTALFLA